MMSDVEALFDISVVFNQLCVGFVSGIARVNSATDRTPDRRHGDDSCFSQHYCWTSGELYVFSEQTN